MPYKLEEKNFDSSQKEHHRNSYNSLRGLLSGDVLEQRVYNNNLYTLSLIKIERHTSYNVNLGYRFGEMVIISDYLRNIASKSKLFYRVNTDEFALLYKKKQILTAQMDAKNIIELLNQEVSLIDYHSVPLEVTCGISYGKGKGLIIEAGSAIMEAKISNSNKICVYSEIFNTKPSNKSN